MPELPEVETVLRGLESKLSDTPISALHEYYPGTVIIDEAVIRPAFPAVVSSYLRKGKYIVLLLHNSNALVIHLRMTGKLIYAAADYQDTGHIRAVFDLDNGCKLLFDDVRTFGKIILCPEGSIDTYLPELGAEPLSREFNTAYLASKLSGKKAPIKTVLLDQAIVAGLGNIYVCEILYRAKIHPETKPIELKPPDVKRIVLHTKEVIKAAIAANGTSISDFRQIDDKTGDFQNFLNVYQKDTCPLKHPVKRIKQAGRSTFYCPVCQK